MNDEYQYDVGITLLSSDLKQAGSLRDRLVSAGVQRERIFLYEDHKATVAREGDMHTLFKNVFEHQCRVVLLLYRDGWGDKGMTSVELEAIRSRRVATGSYNFLVMLNLDPPKCPEWFPYKLQHYAILKEDGEQGVVSLVRDRLRSLGAYERKETQLDRLRRKQLEEEARRERARMRELAGPREVQREAGLLYGEIEKQVQRYREKLGVHCTFETTLRAAVVNFGEWGSMILEWAPGDSDILSSVVAIMRSEHQSLRWYRHGPEPIDLWRVEAEIDYDGEQWGWNVLPHSNAPLPAPTGFTSSADLAEWLMGCLAERGLQDRPPPRRVEQRQFPPRTNWVTDW